MGLLKLLILGILLGVGGYYLGIYMKGSMCHLSNRIDGKNVLITGANTGIGLETAVELASRGGIIHMACRNNVKCESARQEVLRRTEVDPSYVITHVLDLASIKSILGFTRSFTQTVSKLDILINNAGIMMCPYSETEDGFERQIGVNHLGHFLLTNELLSLIKAADLPRIIIVSSLAHEYGSIDTDDINLRGEKYGPSASYAQSKLANVLHAKALAKRLKDNGVAVVSLHPGSVATELQREWPEVMQKIFSGFQFWIVKTAREGAQTQICCAVDSDLFKHSGEYFNDCRPSSSYNRQINNETLSEWLWEISEDLINEKIKTL